MAMPLKREPWALRRNSVFGIISSLIGRLVTQTNELGVGQGDALLEM
jgi:hypothetical protein